MLSQSFLTFRWICHSYFESNNDKSPTRWKNLLLHPVLHNTTNPSILVKADIVLNGAPCFHDGSSDWMHWKPIDWSNLAENATSMFYGRDFPPRSTIIEGNTHAPHPNGSAVLLIAAEGLQLTANEFGKRTPSGQLKDNVALVATCSDGALCSATNVFMRANTGFSATTDQSSAVLTNRGLLHLLPTKQAYHGHVGFHTWSNEDPAPLFSPRNIIGSGSRSESPTNPFTWAASAGTCNITQPHKTGSEQQFGKYYSCHCNASFVTPGSE